MDTGAKISFEILVLNDLLRTGAIDQPIYDEAAKELSEKRIYSAQDANDMTLAIA